MSPERDETKVLTLVSFMVLWSCARPLPCRPARRPKDALNLSSF